MIAHAMLAMTLVTFQFPGPQLSKIIFWTDEKQAYQAHPSHLCHPTGHQMNYAFGHGGCQSVREGEVSQPLPWSDAIYGHWPAEPQA